MYKQVKALPNSFISGASIDLQIIIDLNQITIVNGWRKRRQSDDNNKKLSIEFGTHSIIRSTICR